MMEKLASAQTLQRMSHAFEVSRSGYYKYLNQAKNGKRNKKNILLLKQMLNIWLQSRRAYGSPRLKVALTNMGYKVNRKRIVRVMRKAIESRGIDNVLICNSDQGTQYALNEFKQMLKQYGVIQSMSRNSNFYENAQSIPFFLPLNIHTNL